MRHCGERAARTRIIGQENFSPSNPAGWSAIHVVKIVASLTEEMLISEDQDTAAVVINWEVERFEWLLSCLVSCGTSSDGE